MQETNATGSVGNEYVNKNLPGTPGTVLDKVDRNVLQREGKNLVQSAGLTLDSPSSSEGANTNQFAKAVPLIAGSTPCVDTGSLNTYEVAPILSAIVAPTSYALMDGYVAMFEVNTVNTLASTCNYNTIGAKPIFWQGAALIGNELSGKVSLQFDVVNDRWNLLISGSMPAKAWINYKGTATRSIRKALNFSSVTYNSTGNYTFNFQNNMPDIDYIVVHGCCQDSGGTSANQDTLRIYNLTVSSFTVKCNGSESGLVDFENLFFAVFTI